MVLMGRTEPRLWTPPLRRLTRTTSHGYAVADFAEARGVRLMPWQRWLLIHALERRPRGGGGGYRFRTVLVLVSRQNGKTTVAKVVSLERMQEAATTILGTSTNLEYARDAFEACVDLAEDTQPDDIARVLRGAANTRMSLTNGSEYRMAAANRRGGRSLSVDLAVLDELREHQSWDAWGASQGATAARPDPQMWTLSNMGDDDSVVLNHLRDQAVSAIEIGGDDTLGIFEWSGPEGCELDDRAAWAQANPALGYTITEDRLISLLSTTTPEVFRTEHLCQRVRTMDSAVDMAAWIDCTDVGTLDELRDRVAVCIDVSLDLHHVTLVAAALTSTGRVRVDVTAAWKSVDQARAELPNWLDKIKPRSIGWYPKGPGAALAVDLGDDATPLADMSAVCLGLTEQVQARRVLHSADPLLTAQLEGTAKYWSGDGWRFSRRGAGHCDAVYAMAGAVHLARILPPPKPPLVVL